MIYRVLQTELETSQKSRYQIARDTGVSEAILSKLINKKRGISVRHAETLLSYFGYNLTKELK